VCVWVCLMWCGGVCDTLCGSCGQDLEGGLPKKTPGFLHENFVS